MGGSSTQNSSQTTTTSLPQNQQTNVDALLQGALDFFQTGGREFFPGDTVADFNPFQIQGQNQLVNFANGVGSDLIGQAQENNAFFTDRNNIFNLENIPGFQGSVDDITRTFTDNLTQNILPVVRGGGTATGQFGGSASGIGQALAVGDSNQGLTDSLSNLHLGAFQSGLNTFNQALDRTPDLFALGLAPGQVTSGVGDIRQQQAQNEIQGERERFDFAQNEPAFMLSLLQALTGTSGQFGGTVQSDGTTSIDSGGVFSLQSAEP